MNYLFKNTGRVCTVLALAATTMLSSCLKDNSPGSVDFSKSPALIGFQYAGFSATPYTISVLPTANYVNSAVEVTLSVPSITLGSAVTCKLVEDTQAENADLTANPSHHILPKSLYTMSSNITISPGQHIVTVPITFPQANTMDFTQNYILAFQIQDASGATIETNLYKAFLNIVLKSPYDDTYSINGFVFRDTGGGVNDNTGLGGYFTGLTQALTTVTANTVNFAPLWANGQSAGGVGGTTITVNANNSITVTSSGNASLINTPGYNNHYDPSTKTMYISFKWGVYPSDRSETDTLKAQ